MPVGGECLNRQRTVAQYRAIDLFLFAAMLAVFEYAVTVAATRWFPRQAYTVSLTPVITAIVMMRWGPWAAIHAALGGVVFCAASGATLRQYIIYIAGNLLGLTALVYRRARGPENIRQDALRSMFFGLMTALLMQAGRAIVAIIMGVAPESALGFVTTDAITLLLTVVIMWIVRRLDGVFEEQTHYLRRVQEEARQERGGY